MKRYCLYLFILIGISCSAELKAQKNGTVYKGNDPAVRYTGRTLVSPDGSVAFDWVGTYLETRFTGGKLSVKVSETGTSYYNVFVDGKLHKVVKVCGTDTLIHLVSGIDKRIHSLKIQKRSEGEFGNCPSVCLVRFGTPGGRAGSAHTAYRVYRKLTHLRIWHRRETSR